VWSLNTSPNISRQLSLGEQSSAASQASVCLQSRQLDRPAVLQRYTPLEAACGPLTGPGSVRAATAAWSTRGARNRITSLSGPHCQALSLSAARLPGSQCSKSTERPVKYHRVITDGAQRRAALPDTRTLAGGGPLQRVQRNAPLAPSLALAAAAGTVSSCVSRRAARSYSILVWRFWRAAARSFCSAAWRRCASSGATDRRPFTMSLVLPK